ncbi:MAG TPA: methyltransferase domain-containing protein [Devosiaceae bacterium]|nr:methyltransferase domain-containing protein [Devosiaceae bacterium]
MTSIPFEPRRFRSTVAFYSRYRIPYPEALIASVAQRVGLESGDRMLDLGCGPGPLALAFATLGARVTAMDPEPDMLAAARAAAAEAELDIEFRQGSSYDLTPELGSFKLVTMGRSFHWMDRKATLEMLDRIVVPEGAVALFADRRISSTPDWRKLTEALADKLVPNRNDTRKIRRSDQWAPHEAMLLHSSFSEVEMLGRIFEREITIEDVIGRALSTSATSPEVLGEHQTTFEEALRAQLEAEAPDGRVTEIVGTDAVLAFRAAGEDA